MIDKLSIKNKKELDDIINKLISIKNKKELDDIINKLITINYQMHIK